MTLPASTTVEDLPLEQLQEWGRNPRRISKPRLEALKRALVAEPEMLRARPLIALPDGTVVAGNQRLRAARELGWASLPVVVVDLDEARAAEWALRDNRPYGEDDEQLVGALLAELATDGRALDLTGYDSGEVDRLLAAVRPAPAVDPDEAPALPAVPRSVHGEVYELGPHRLMCGDATSADDQQTLLRGERPTVGIADPPYNVDEEYETYDDDRADEDYATFTGEWFPLLVSSTTRQIVTPGWNNLPLWCRLHRFRAIAAWTKSNAMTRGSVSRFNTWEPILFFGEGWRNRERSSDVFDVPVRQQPGGAGMPINGVAHPCPKPVELWRDLLAVGLSSDEMAFDPFAGAGTVLIAAEQTRRRCFAMEIDPAYCDVIRQRYADFTGQPGLAP